MTIKNCADCGGDHFGSNRCPFTEAKAMGHSEIGHKGAHVDMFPVGAHVGYRPGAGTYGYEDVPKVDGRILAKVVGHTGKRVRVELNWTSGDRQCSKRVAVDAESLVKVAATPGRE